MYMRQCRSITLKLCPYSKPGTLMLSMPGSLESSQQLRIKQIDEHATCFSACEILRILSQFPLLSFDTIVKYFDYRKHFWPWTARATCCSRRKDGLLSKPLKIFPEMTPVLAV